MRNIYIRRENDPFFRTIRRSIHSCRSIVLSQGPFCRVVLSYPHGGQKNFHMRPMCSLAHLWCPLYVPISSTSCSCSHLICWSWLDPWPLLYAYDTYYMLVLYAWLTACGWLAARSWPALPTSGPPDRSACMALPVWLCIYCSACGSLARSHSVGPYSLPHYAATNLCLTLSCSACSYLLLVPHWPRAAANRTRKVKVPITSYIKVDTSGHS